MNEMIKNDKVGYKHLVTRAAWFATIVASSLFIVKLVIWWITGSLSLMASVIDSLLDIVASAINLVVISYSLRPADDNHAFGHGKAESLAALAQAIFISGSAIFLILNGIERIFRPHELQHHALGISLSFMVMLVTCALILYQKKVVHLTGSQAIAADSLHYQTDLYMNAAIMVAFILSYFGITKADVIFAIGMGCYILYNAAKMVYMASQVLLDHTLPDEDIERIKDICLAKPEVLGVHQLRTRLSGQTKFIQLNLELSDDLPLIDAHKIAEIVEQNLLTEFPQADIIIHQEPS